MTKHTQDRNKNQQHSGGQNKRKTTGYKDLLKDTGVSLSLPSLRHI